MKRILYFLLIILLIVAAILLVKNNYHKPVIKVGQLNQLGRPGKLTYALKDILEERYRVVITDMDYDIVVDDVFGSKDIKNIDRPDVIKIFYTAEAYLPNLDDYDLVLGFDRVDDPRYIRYPNYYNGYNGKSIEGTKARDSMFHRLSEYKWVASGGVHLNNIGGPVPRKSKKTQEWLSQCKFIISYENQYHNGYLTEKVFQAYFGGAIPIYWGDKTAISDINKDAVIYADDFEAENDVVEYVKKVDNDDELYCKIWNQHLMTNPEMNYEIVKDKLREKLFKLIDTKLQK